MHLLALHEHGSSNPLGVSGNTDRLPFHPYFVFKDLVTVFVFLLVLSIVVFYAPNMMGHSDNYIPANPMQTPPSINIYHPIVLLTLSVMPLAPEANDTFILDLNSDNPLADASMIELDEALDINPSPETVGKVRVEGEVLSITLIELQALLAAQLNLAVNETAL
jgi:hypothetical protein